MSSKRVKIFLFQENLDISQSGNKEYYKLIRCDKVKGAFVVPCALLFRMKRVLITDLNGKVLDTVDYSDLYGVTYLAGPPPKNATAAQKVKGEVYYFEIHQYKKVAKKGLLGKSESKRSLFQVSILPLISGITRNF